MRISGVAIPDNKQIEFGLQKLYGVGRTRARLILENAKIPFNARAKDLSIDDENRIRKQIEEFLTEGDLRREISANIKRLKDIGSYRGSRHARHLPARGQRTKTNSRTVRGNVRKTMGSGKRKLDKK